MNSLVVCVALALPLYAVDGVVLINQNVALAGNVTPGDTPGFPVTISVTGSYKLSGNLTVPDANTTAILINADDVTIDLNGFSIIGPTVCGELSCPTGSGNGIAAFFHSHLTVLNGVIRGMGSSGVFFESSVSSRVEKIHAYSNGSDGITLGIDIVTSCTADLNGGDGINVVGGQVSDNLVFKNRGNGISLFNHAVVTNNLFFFNGKSGIVDVGTIGGSLFSGNSASSNGAAGISAVCPSLITGNSALGNTGGDIFAGGSGCVRVNNSPAP